MPFPSLLELDFTPNFFETDAPAGIRIGCRIEQGARGLRVTVSGPNTRLPGPPGPPGRFEELWRHDVVEVFLLGEAENYLELELGPHGHFWLLVLAGCRRIVAELEPQEHTWRRGADRWEATVGLPAAALPPGLRAFNVTTILGPERLHGSYVPLPGDRPDFHQLGRFAFPG